MGSSIFDFPILATPRVYSHQNSKMAHECSFRASRLRCHHHLYHTVTSKWHWSGYPEGNIRYGGFSPRSAVDGN